jgi:hypothetical protein
MKIITELVDGWDLRNWYNMNGQLRALSNTFFRTKQQVIKSLDNLFPEDPEKGWELLFDVLENLRQDFNEDTLSYYVINHMDTLEQYLDNL